VAAYQLSEILGWGLVPPTLERDGPYGPGSVQLFVDAEFEEHYFTLRGRPEQRAALTRICAFDLIANNADRKSGHCLLGRDGRLYAIDNGLCFHVEPKLRTVVWDFARADPRGPGRGQPARRPGSARLACDLLEPGERAALHARAGAQRRAEQFPEDSTGMRYPWPLV
jgi:uncharacterized repeat protein (TIGR03843 family)